MSEAECHVCGDWNLLRPQGGLMVCPKCAEPEDAELSRLRAEVERKNKLMEKLAEHVAHDSGCMAGYTHDGKGVCDCGLAEVLKEFLGEPHAT